MAVVLLLGLHFTWTQALFMISLESEWALPQVPVQRQGLEGIEVNSPLHYHAALCVGRCSWNMNNKRFWGAVQASGLGISVCAAFLKQRVGPITTWRMRILKLLVWGLRSGVSYPAGCLHSARASFIAMGPAPWMRREQASGKCGWFFITKPFWAAAGFELCFGYSGPWPWSECSSPHRQPIIDSDLPLCFSSMYFSEIRRGEWFSGLACWGMVMSVYSQSWTLLSCHGNNWKQWSTILRLLIGHPIG